MKLPLRNAGGSEQTQLNTSGLGKNQGAMVVGITLQLLRKQVKKKKGDRENRSRCNDVLLQRVQMCR